MVVITFIHKRELHCRMISLKNVASVLKGRYSDSCFISSQVGEIGPWDVNDGLPTLEMHRQLPVTVQAKHLFATNLIDDVVIGNAYASNEELEALGQLNRYQTELTIVLKKRLLKLKRNRNKNQHFRRGDITQQMIRSTEVRKNIK